MVSRYQFVYFKRRHLELHPIQLAQQLPRLTYLQYICYAAEQFSTLHFFLALKYKTSSKCALDFALMQEPTMNTGLLAGD
jgi:hypothetical protein